MRPRRVEIHVVLEWFDEQTLRAQVRVPRVTQVDDNEPPVLHDSGMPRLVPLDATYLLSDTDMGATSLARAVIAHYLMRAFDTFGLRV